VVQHSEELEPHLEARRRHHEAKRALATEIIARRMSLREAVEHFQRLDEEATGFPPGFLLPRKDEQTLRESVLLYVWMVLSHQGQFTAAARWYGEVFRAQPHLLTGSPTVHRYQAACAAVLAGCGQATDAADLNANSRAGFRRQALDWLGAELEAQHRLLEKEPEKTRSIYYELQHWLEDPAFAGVREPEALARLPEPERTAWQKLWADVADMLARAQGTTAPK
jgi:hypothetical protein